MKKIRNILLILCVVCLMAGCGKEPATGENVYNIYYVSNSENKVELHTYEASGTEDAEVLGELIECLSVMPEKLEYKAPLALGFTLQNVELQDGKCQLTVSKDYKNLPFTTEVLVRAALVRTLTQIDSVQYVGISLEGESLMDSTGAPVGWMSAEQFIDNDGNEINTYELGKVKLYFAGHDGTHLISAYREKRYLSTSSKERFVVQELIYGPSGQVEGLYPTIHPGTQIINVTTKDGICYVNLSAHFLTAVNNVPVEMSIYSIVNSLVELSSVNKVQILVDGKIPDTFSRSLYERNLDIVKTLEESRASVLEETEENTE